MTEHNFEHMRRAMVATMSMVRDQVVPCTLFDDADLALWREGNDYTIRLLRAIAAGCARRKFIAGVRLFLSRSKM